MSQLSQLSKDLVALVQEAAGAVVRIDGRRGAAASGTAWSADGVVVAADHSVEDDEVVTVGLASGEAVRADVVGRDAATDLVALRLQGGAAVTPPRWSDEGQPGSGQLVVGLSRPGRAIRADLGILARTSGAWRAPSGGRLERYLETSLALRPGLSGGLLLDADGRALGLVTAGLLRGLAMAIPVEALRRLVRELLDHGRLRRGYLGLATLPIRLPAAAAERHGQAGALLVSGVEPESPADRAGLLLGDAVLAIDGQAVESPHDLAPALEPERIGAALPLKVLRAGEARELTLTVGARPTSGGAR
jgi:S1-C subfamily serine protease